MNEKKSYKWVERCPEMPTFLGPYETYDEAIDGAHEWKNSGGLLSPEHHEIFLISIQGNKMDLVKDEGCVVTFGRLFW